MFSSALFFLLGLASISQCCREPWKVINDTEVTEDLKSQVAVRRKQYPMHLCIGSLVNPLYIVTVAQCIFTYTADMLLIANIPVIEEYYFAREDQVREIFVHEDFNYFTRNSDIALLRMYVPLGPWRTRTYPSLPKQGELVFGGMSGILFGVSRVYFPERIGQTIDYTRICTHSIQLCKKLDPVIRDTNICASDPFEHKSCRYNLLLQANTGGLLIYNKTLIGLLSRARPINCSVTDDTTVFTRVSAYTDWIKTNMRKRLYDDVYPPPFHEHWTA